MQASTSLLRSIVACGEVALSPATLAQTARIADSKHSSNGAASPARGTHCLFTHVPRCSNPLTVLTPVRAVMLNQPRSRLADSQERPIGRPLVLWPFPGGASPVEAATDRGAPGTTRIRMSKPAALCLAYRVSRSALALSVQSFAGRVSTGGAHNGSSATSTNKIAHKPVKEVLSIRSPQIRCQTLILSDSTMHV